MSTSLATGPLAAQAQSSLLQARQDRALHEIQAGTKARNHDQIEKGAREFESMLLTTWLQQAQQTMASVPGADDEDQMSGKEQLTSMGVQALASALTASGGLGIASMIAKAMHRAADNEAAKAAQNESLTLPKNVK